MFPRIQFWTESCVRSILHRIDEFLPLVRTMLLCNRARLLVVPIKHLFEFGFTPDASPPLLSIP